MFAMYVSRNVQFYVPCCPTGSAVIAEKAMSFFVGFEHSLCISIGFAIPEWLCSRRSPKSGLVVFPCVRFLVLSRSQPSQERYAWRGQGMDPKVPDPSPPHCASALWKSE